ncbi:acetylxylan esterase [Mucilaginibacter sp. PAMB04274]|uniref:acetylxylan esterase n=1 Tax=Mucilaginibacter sp. PAMB04274 TaxID=3138568 RepID=UPI0031F61403
MLHAIKTLVGKGLLACLLLLLCSTSFVCASIINPYSGSVALRDAEEVVWEAKPSKKDALYQSNERIIYKVDVKNGLKEDQKGTLSYLILSSANKEISRSSISVNIGKKSSAKYNLSLPTQSAGFYKVNILLNVTDYDDTIRRVIGINPQQIRSESSKPADFDEFWNTAKNDLAKIAPNFKVTAQPDSDKKNTNVFLVEAKSYGNITVRGWLTLPKDRKPKEKFPVWVILPGYGGEGVKPIYGSPQMAVFSFNVRGHGNSRDVVHTTTEAYVTTDVENRNKYVFKGAILDCIRAIDFISSRKDLDSSQIIVSGASMGGYLSIALASLDKRVKLCSSNNPVFCDYRGLVGSKEWPMKSFVDYGRKRRIALNTILYNLDYYDLKNFSDQLKCPSLIGISLLDNLAPPTNEYAMINNITKAKYKLFVFPELAHEVPPSIYSYLSNWMMDEFGMF